jgi:peroxisomal enoyl-CoA hydratase 2
MSGPGAGYEYPPVPVSWYKRDVLLFANSIGATVDELHLLYVGSLIRKKIRIGTS